MNNLSEKEEESDFTEVEKKYDENMKKLISDVVENVKEESLLLCIQEYYMLAEYYGENNWDKNKNKISLFPKKRELLKHLLISRCIAIDIEFNMEYIDGIQKIKKDNLCSKMIRKMIGERR